MGTNSKKLITAAAQNQFLAVSLAQYHAAVEELANRKSISEIGPVRLWCLCHDLPPEQFDTSSGSMMLAVVEPMVRFILLANSQVSQTSRRVQVTSRLATWAHSPLDHRPRPRQASLQEQTPFDNQGPRCFANRIQSWHHAAISDSGASRVTRPRFLKASHRAPTSRGFG